MEILTGAAVCSGVAIAEAVVLEAEEYRIQRRSVAPEDVTAERTILQAALRGAVAELLHQLEVTANQVGKDAAEVFRWHIGVLQDPRFQGEIETLIQEKCYSAAHATSTVMRNLQRRFLRMNDPLLVERLRDVQDIERRLLRHILGESREDLAHLTQGVILIAHDLSPSQSAHLGSTLVTGIALDAGGPTSHTAILLRALGRPSVIGLGDISTRVSGGDLVIVDGNNQLVIVAPDESTLAEYRNQERSYVRLTDELGHLRDLPAVTRDEVRVHLMANIEFPDEAGRCVEKGADGIGLYRTEFLFLSGKGDPSEEEQLAAYRAAIEGADAGVGRVIDPTLRTHRPVIIRTFDLGADKYTQDKSYEREPNPMLGLRSIRYSLRHLDMFKVQLRAILRASALGNVSVMFPLISSLMELRQAKMTLHDAMEDLEEEGLPFRRDIPVGMMLETPAAALQCQLFAHEVRFMSIGTNDLVQYMLAVDRGNERVSRYYTTSHPSVIRCLDTIIRTCNERGVAVSLCGEMAGEPLYTLLLLGMGLRTFSMAPGSVPKIKKLIRLARTQDAERMAQKALTFETESQVANYLRGETRKLLPDDPI